MEVNELKAEGYELLLQLLAAQQQVAQYQQQTIVPLEAKIAEIQKQIAEVSDTDGE